MSRVIAFVKEFPTVAFFILAFVLFHGVSLIANAVYAATNSFILALPIALLGAGPLASALIVTAIIGRKPGLAALVRQFTVWRVGPRWYLIALLLPPAIHLVAIYMNVLLGAPAPTAAAFGTWTAILGAFALRLVNPFDGPMLEELGWRGFALPRLQRRMTPLTANLVLGLLVALWHLPLILYGQYSWIYVPGTIAATILFGWVYNATGGSVLLTLLMHVTDGLLINAYFNGVYETRYSALLVLAYVCTAVVVVLFAGRNLGRPETEASETESKPAVVPV